MTVPFARHRRSCEALINALELMVTFNVVHPTQKLCAITVEDENTVTGNEIKTMMARMERIYALSENIRKINGTKHSTSRWFCMSLPLIQGLQH